MFDNARLPAFCEMQMFEIHGTVSDHKGIPLAGVYVIPSEWLLADGKWNHLGESEISIQTKQGVTGQDGSFVIRKAFDQGLLSANGDFTFFTLGIYDEMYHSFGRHTPVYRVSGFFSGGGVVKSLFRAQKAKRTGTNLSNFSVKIPRAFDWSPQFCS